MTDPIAASWLTIVRAIRAGDGAARPAACLDDETIAALADGSLDAGRRTAVVPHLAGCGPCRRDVAAVVRALADPAVAREVVATAAPAHRWPRARVAVASIIGLAALLGLMVRPQREAPAPSHRAPITVSPVPQAIAPMGDVATAAALRWQPVPGADRYRISLFDATGAVRYEVVQESTVVVLPDSVRPATGAQYWWIVDARVGFDRWTASGLIPFRVMAPLP